MPPLGRPGRDNGDHDVASHIRCEAGKKTLRRHWNAVRHRTLRTGLVGSSGGKPALLVAKTPPPRQRPHRRTLPRASRPAIDVRSAPGAVIGSSPKCGLAISPEDGRHPNTVRISRSALPFALGGGRTLRWSWYQHWRRTWHWSASAVGRCSPKSVRPRAGRRRQWREPPEYLGPQCGPPPHCLAWDQSVGAMGGEIGRIR